MLRRLLFVLALCVFPIRWAEAQWADPRLVAGQVGFGIVTSFFGKLIFAHESPGEAFKQALVEGAAWGMVAHSGYCVAGGNPHLALVGKTLAQKSALMGRRSIHGEPVFDRSLYSHWQLTHSFVYFEFNGTPRVEIDAINASFATYYLLSDGYHLDPGRSLYGGSLVFHNDRPPEHIRGFFVPGAIWLADTEDYDESVFAHELIHSLQAERGSTFADLHAKGFRFNFLVLTSGAPALLDGWPDHDQRLHEREADRYAGRK
jgi:hypothetical protein